MARRTEEIESQEIKRPMATPEISFADQIEAMKLQIADLERRITEHERHHFGTPIE